MLKSQDLHVFLIKYRNEITRITRGARPALPKTMFSNSIFYKNSPLHDGAIVIRNNRIIAARCILPVTNDDNFPGELGMRHRAAVGVSEHSDALTIIVSEQNGKISCAQNGKIRVDLSEIQLRNTINKIN